jgi:hypothetical protein
MVERITELEQNWDSKVNGAPAGNTVPSVLHIPHSTETLTHACTHTVRLRLLAFCSASKTNNQKAPHTCL